MRRAIVNLTGTSSLIFSKRHYTPRLEGDKETDDEYEARTWREKAHFGSNGKVIIPPSMLKYALNSTAKFLSIPMEGKRAKTYTKYFESGIVIYECVEIDATKDDLECIWIECDTQGRKGGFGGRRVRRAFPFVRDWQGTAEFIILGEEPPNRIFESVMRQVGIVNGIGSFRPQNGGWSGRFAAEVVKIEPYTFGV